MGFYSLCGVVGEVIVDQEGLCAIQALPLTPSFFYPNFVMETYYALVSNIMYTD